MFCFGRKVMKTLLLDKYNQFGQNLETHSVRANSSWKADSSKTYKLSSGKLSVANSNNSIMFIDRSVAAYSTLAAAALPGVEVVLLDPAQDGIEQISSVLAQHRNIVSLHLITNGQTGQIQLGSIRLSSANMQQYNDQLRGWAKSFTSNADILLYGCNVASGELGRQFIQQLSYLTETDVTASINLTGSTQQGGDWKLEAKTGTIEAALPF